MSPDGWDDSTPHDPLHRLDGPPSTLTAPAPRRTPMTDQSIALDDLRDQLNAYSLAAAEIEKWKNIQAAARAAIEQALGDAEVGTVDGAKAVTWTRSERTTIDTKRLQADLPPDVLAPYTRTTIVRTFKPVAAGATR